MLLLQEYVNDPCGTLSIPYWKSKELAVPQNMKIIHDRDFSVGMLRGYKDEPYFRLSHNLKNIGQVFLTDVEPVSGSSNINEFVWLINASYSDISITKEQIESYRRTPVYCPDLWILFKEQNSNNIVAGGIADYDRETNELILEWIQVLPHYRRKGYGQLIVNSLLLKMQGIAEFATVSGKVNNPTNPQSLYRKCGFIGDDVWHILTQK
jgi:GNAT superfamily N-acetyltransferase